MLEGLGHNLDLLFLNSCLDFEFRESVYTNCSVIKTNAKFNYKHSELAALLYYGQIRHKIAILCL